MKHARSHSRNARIARNGPIGVISGSVTTGVVALGEGCCLAGCGTRKARHVQPAGFFGDAGDRSRISGNRVMPIVGDSGVPRAGVVVRSWVVEVTASRRSRVQNASSDP